MPCSSLGTRLSFLGTPVFGSRRARGWSALMAIAGTIILAPPSHDTVVAQATPAPAVRVVRDVRFEGQVWPTDINGDGVTDLISSSETRFVNGVQTGGMVQVALGRGDGTFDNPVVSSIKGNVVGATDFNGDGNRDVIAEISDRRHGRRLLRHPARQRHDGAGRAADDRARVEVLVRADGRHERRRKAGPDHRRVQRRSGLPRERRLHVRHAGDVGGLATARSRASSPTSTATASATWRSPTSPTRCRFSSTRARCCSRPPTCRSPQQVTDVTAARRQRRRPHRPAGVGRPRRRGLRFRQRLRLRAAGQWQRHLRHAGRVSGGDRDPGRSSPATSTATASLISPPAIRSSIFRDDCAVPSAKTWDSVSILRGVGQRRVHRPVELLDWRPERYRTRSTRMTTATATR